MLIDPFSSDLVPGYKEIATARQALLKKWRFELLRAYTKKWDRYARELAQQEARRERYQSFLPFIGLILLVICSIGAWLTFRNLDLACLGMFLMLGTGFGALLAVTPWLGFSRKPPPPENPVTRTSGDETESRLRQRLFPRLVPLWRRQMALRVPNPQEAEGMAAETGRWELTGELDLIRALEGVASPETYILHSLQLSPSDAMDVVVIGPRGFWYFEVIPWSADFIWQDGAWRIEQFDSATRSPQLLTLDEYPDEQWSRIREEALGILKTKAGKLLKKAPVTGRIQGGVVFTHPNARLEVDSSAPFRYGTIEEWVASYQAAPRLREMKPGRTLLLLEILLRRHQSFYPDVPRRSMKDAILNVIAEVERGIQAWIET
jgi:hypothetical protein